MPLNTINEIKKELVLLPEKQLVEFLALLARYKKDNKEYLNYLLYYSDNKDAFVNSIVEEIDLQFASIDVKANLYYCKKSLRKILRILTKYSRYVDDKQVSTRLLIYFCRKLKDSGIPFHESKILVNLYNQQLKKINALMENLHEDYRHDFKIEMENLF